MKLHSPKPAALGGKPAFTKKVPIIQPTLPEVHELTPHLRKIFASYNITNAAYVKKLEKEFSRYSSVRHAVAVANCTAGLMLVFKSLELKGEALVPSFTFSATAHALMWNNLKPVYVDCDRETFNIDLNDARKKLTKKTCAVVGVYIYGVPPDMKGLRKFTREHGLKFVCDSAHAMGTTVNGVKAGNFADAEVFSMSPTKLVAAGEGGMVATQDSDLARKLRIGRDYGNPGNYNCEFAGLNARLSEFHALLGWLNLKKLTLRVRHRNKLYALYKNELSALPGISFQKIAPGVVTSCNYFPVVVDAKKFGLSRDALFDCMEKENIATKKYFYPAVHEQEATRIYARGKGGLPATEWLSRHVLCLPLYSHLKEETARKICCAVGRIQRHASGIARKI